MENNLLIGPFFWIRSKLIFNTIPANEGRIQAGKYDNPYSHEKLFDDNFRQGDYIDFPRGRVIWDSEENRSVIYIDPCINRQNVIDRICEVFCLEKYIVSGDEHYHCRKCAGKLFD